MNEYAAEPTTKGDILLLQNYGTNTFFFMEDKGNGLTLLLVNGKSPLFGSPGQATKWLKGER